MIVPFCLTYYVPFSAEFEIYCPDIRLLEPTLCIGANTVSHILVIYHDRHIQRYMR